jgi:hypothetical protein
MTKRLILLDVAASLAVAAMNGPFSSVRYTGTGTPSRIESGRLWHHVKYPTRIAPLSWPDCVPSYNYSSNTPDSAQRIPGLNLTKAGYRYLTRSGGVRTADLHRYGCRAAVHATRRSFGWWPAPKHSPACPS